jgi:hypothetical protein
MKKLLVFLLPATFLLMCTNTRVSVEESPENFSSNPMGSGPALEIEMTRGEGHNHPLMAIWIETPDGNFVQTLYVAESIGKGVFSMVMHLVDSGWQARSNDLQHCRTGPINGALKTIRDCICPSLPIRFLMPLPVPLRARVLYYIRSSMNRV